MQHVKEKLYTELMRGITGGELSKVCLAIADWG